MTINIMGRMKVAMVVKVCACSGQNGPQAKDSALDPDIDRLLFCRLGNRTLLRAFVRDKHWMIFFILFDKSIPR